MEATRSQMHAMKVPLELWGEAASYSVYVQNRVISSTGQSTPFELWHGTKPDVSHLRVFGCLAFAHVPEEKRKKLDCKATEGMMVGYSETSKA